ncbi:MAG: tetratricopeptide repeat protein [Tenuifilaceae bacterium]
MKKSKSIFLLIFSLSFLGTLVAQQPVNRKEVDSLLRIVRVSSTEDKVSHFDNISKLFLGRNNDSVFHYANKSFEEAQIDKSDFSYGLAYFSLANACADKFDYSKALEYFLKSKDYRERSGEKDKRIQVLFSIARTYINLKRFSESIETYKQAVDIAREIEDYNNEGLLLFGISNAYYEINDLNRSLEYAIKSANIQILHNIQTELGDTYNFIGYIHQSLRNYDLAEEYYLKSHEIYQKKNDIKGLSMTLNNLGIIYNINGDNQKSLEYYSKSLEYAKKLNDNDGIATALNNIGMINVELGLIGKGLDSYFESLQHSKRLFNKTGYANTYNNIAAAYLKSNDLVKAEKNVYYALEFARQLTDLTIIQESYQILAKIYSAKGLYSKAFEFLGLQLAYNDSLYNQERTRNILEMQTRFETEAKEKEIQLLKKDNEIRQLEVERHKSFQKYLLISSILLLILVAVIYFSLSIKRKTYKLISQKNFELEIANQKLKESEQTQRELNATKDKFFSIIAHDLKNPFNALLGFSELLEKNYDTYTKAEVKEYINVIYESSQSLFKLLDNLLQWSRTQTGTIIYHKEHFNLLQIVRQEIDLLQINADKKRINIKVLVDEKLTAFADKNIIATVVRNLLNNAIKFTNTSGIVEIWARETPDNIEVSVTDSGIGIDSNDLSKLFQLNSSLSNKGTANEEGTGLGLLLCKEFIEKNGGKIWVTSSKGKGSTFFFTLPK